MDAAAIDYLTLIAFYNAPYLNAHQKWLLKCTTWNKKMKWSVLNYLCTEHC